MGRPKQVYAQVMIDLRDREKMGIEKYGVSVDKAELNTGGAFVSYEKTNSKR